MIMFKTLGVCVHKVEDKFSENNDVIYFYRRTHCDNKQHQQYRIKDLTSDKQYNYMSKILYVG